MFKELKGVVGLGQHQVTKDVGRVERSVAVSIMAYLLLLRLKAQQVPADHSWSGRRSHGHFVGEAAISDCCEET